MKFVYVDVQPKEVEKQSKEYSRNKYANWISSSKTIDQTYIFKL